MNDWEKILLLGTDHFVLPAEIRKYYTDMGLDATLSDSAFMRISLAMHVGLKKISSPVSSSNKPDLISKSNEDNKVDPYISNEIIIPFHQLNFFKSICKKYSNIDIHLELFELLKIENRFIPIVLLPSLFDISCKEPVYFKKLKPVISENGYLLLQKNKKWTTLLPVKDEDVWYLGTFQERYSLLTYLCSTLPELALKLLSNTWKEESIYDKIQFLLLLDKRDILPSPNLLSLIIDDNDFELLKITTRIRYRLIPNDPALNQLKEDILSCFSYIDQTLWIKIPEEWPKTWTLSGIHPDGKFSFSYSKKRNAYLQAISLFEPFLWNEKLNLSPEKFLQLLIKESLYFSFLPQLIQAILYYKNEEWAYIILHHWIENKETSVLIDEIHPLLIENLSNRESVKLTQAFLLHRKEPLENDSLFLKILLNPYLEWSEKNAQHLQFHLVKMWEKYLSRGFFAFEYYQPLFLLYAKRCPIEDGINEEGWLETLEISSNQPSLFDDYREIINIRKQIRKIL